MTSEFRTPNHNEGIDDSGGIFVLGAGGILGAVFGTVSSVFTGFNPVISGYAGSQIGVFSTIAYLALRPER